MLNGHLGVGMFRTRWGVAGVAAVAFLMGLPPTASATFPGENGVISFISGRSCTEPCDDSSADLFTLTGIGGSVTQRTVLEGQHRHPSWSPDLKTIAYARWASQSDNQKIFIDDLTVTGDEQTRLGPHDSSVLDDRPAWSPNGKFIAYESEVTNGSNQLDIMVVNVETNAFLNLTDTAAISEGKPAWSPDGKFIYYHSNATGDQDIYRERADGSTATPQGIVTNAGNQFQASISPDGKSLCYTQGSFSDSADVFVRSIASSGSAQEISDETITKADYNCDWSPDGKLVTWVTGLLSAGTLVYKNANDTGSILSLTPDAPNAFDGNPDWAPKDPPFCKGKPITISGTSGNDDLVGTRGKDVIAAHGGDDQVNGGGGKDKICGGKGEDTLRGGAANDKLYGEGGGDALIGGVGTDKCDGGPGKDTEQGCEK